MQYYKVYVWKVSVSFHVSFLHFCCLKTWILNLCIPGGWWSGFDSGVMANDLETGDINSGSNGGRVQWVQCSVAVLYFHLSCLSPVNFCGTDLKLWQTSIKIIYFHLVWAFVLPCLYCRGTSARWRAVRSTGESAGSAGVNHEEVWPQLPGRRVEENPYRETRRTEL